MGQLLWESSLEDALVNCVIACKGRAAMLRLRVISRKSEGSACPGVWLSTSGLVVEPSVVGPLRMSFTLNDWTNWSFPSMFNKRDSFEEVLGIHCGAFLVPRSSFWKKGFVFGQCLAH